MIRRTTEHHRVSATNFLVQAVEAQRRGALYRHRLMERGFTFGTTVSDHDSVFPPAGMHYVEAMNISKQIWNEVNDVSVDKDIHS